MNIFEKINAVRMALVKSEITKDKKGYNYAYIDLPQIENLITEECNKVNLCTMVDFPDGHAIMKAWDTEHLGENFSMVEINVPCDSTMVDIKGSQPIQRVGGMLTYMRRYLYMQMFAISEHDAVEGIGNLSRESEAEQEKKAKKKAPKTEKTETPAENTDAEVASADTEKDNTIALFRKNLPDYIPTLEAYQKKKIEEMPVDYLQKVYKVKMQLKEQSNEGNV